MREVYCATLHQYVIAQFIRGYKLSLSSRARIVWVRRELTLVRLTVILSLMLGRSIRSAHVMSTIISSRAMCGRWFIPGIRATSVTSEHRRYIILYSLQHIAELATGDWSVPP